MRMGHNIADATILEETPHTNLGDSFEQFIANGIDKLTKGRKAPFVTNALILAEVVKDPSEFRALSEQNKAALNDYFEQIDIEALLSSDSKAAAPVKAQIKDALTKNAAVLGVGIAVGTGLGMLIRGKSEK